MLNLTPEEALKVARKKARHEARSSVDPEWLYIAEFGYYYGWEGVKAILNNEISLEDASALLQGARKVWYSKVIDTASATYTAVGAVHSKKPKKTMQDGMKGFMKEARP